MEVRMAREKGNAVNGLVPVLTDIQKRLENHPREWLQALQQDPGSFVDLEKAVHHAFQQMADRLVAGLLAQATQGEDFAEVVKKK
jgi:hypothetical protein